MTFLAQIFAWIISDIRHIIIIALSILLIFVSTYAVFLKWETANKDQKISELKVDNERLKLNNQNLILQNEQLVKANEALQKYANSLITIKKDMETIRNKVQTIRSKEDEIENNNALANMWNGR